jgi:uncharacterized protein (DUF2062 family)
MIAAVDSVPPSFPHALIRRSFWQRRVVAPILGLLTQGITADKIAQTLAVGAICSMFPFVGTTWALNLAVGLWLRMNQPILQTLNQLLWAVHLPMILVYVRLGEWIWGVTDERFDLKEMMHAFQDASFAEFLERFGWAGVHAFTAWLATAPLLFVVVYYPVRPILRKLAWKRVPAPVP